MVPTWCVTVLPSSDEIRKVQNYDELVLIVINNVQFNSTIDMASVKSILSVGALEKIQSLTPWTSHRKQEKLPFKEETFSRPRLAWGILLLMASWVEYKKK